MTIAPTRQNIPITETWNRTDWSNFDLSPSISTPSVFGRNGDGDTNDFGLNSQAHINVRNFASNEQWSPTTSIVTGYLPAAQNHWPGLTWSLSAGTQTITSTMSPIDLSPLTGDALLTITLPNFPTNQIVLNTSTLILTDSQGQSATLSWATGSPPSLGGNTSISWPCSTFQSIDTTSVVTITLTVTAAQPATLIIAGLRLVHPQWVPTNVDYDTLSHQLRSTIPLVGDPSYVTPLNFVFPPLWRTARIPGIDDPRPINTDIGFIFNTGSQTATNSFALLMRQVDSALTTQLDLNGTPQYALNGLPQPIAGLPQFSPRTVRDLDQLTMADLDQQTMLNLERTHSTLQTTWVQFLVQWGPTANVSITNANAPSGGHQYSLPTFASSQTYLAVCSLSETTARLQIYNVNQTTLALGNIYFDTTSINDPSSFPRMSGRIGFSANLHDGDSYIGAIRPRKLIYAEYRSKPLQSITPVAGAHLNVQTSPDVELFNTWSAYTNHDGIQPNLSNDSQRYVQNANNQSTRVDIVTVVPGYSQGIVSNNLTPYDDPISGITDFEQLHISLDLWIPGTAIPAGMNSSNIISASLCQMNNGMIMTQYPITLSPALPDQWSHISNIQPFRPPYPQSGIYQLVILYTGLQPMTFWVDNTSVHEHSLTWSGRSVVSDPWKSNYAPWTSFHEVVNSDIDGAVFTTQGSSLQIRGQARRQDATILSPPTITPQYAQLGRFVWPEDVVAVSGLPTATFTVTNTGRTFTFNANASSSPNGMGVYQWNFGDGTFGTGARVTHTYPSYVPAGTLYTVVLSVIDRRGQVATANPSTIAMT